MISIKKHRSYYFFLIAILALGLILFELVAPNRQNQTAVLVLIGLGYFFTGIIHHKEEHNLHPKIVIEYALIASLGITCVLFMLKVGLGL